jgi:hypothetical protein
MISGPALRRTALACPIDPSDRQLQFGRLWFYLKIEGPNFWPMGSRGFPAFF